MQFSLYTGFLISCERWKRTVVRPICGSGGSQSRLRILDRITLCRIKKQLDVKQDLNAKSSRVAVCQAICVEVEIVVPIQTATKQAWTQQAHGINTAGSRAQDTPAMAGLPKCSMLVHTLCSWNILGNSVPWNSAMLRTLHHARVRRFWTCALFARLEHSRSIVLCTNVPMLHLAAIA